MICSRCCRICVPCLHFSGNSSFAAASQRLMMMMICRVIPLSQKHVHLPCFLSISGLIVERVNMSRMIMICTQCTLLMAFNVFTHFDISFFFTQHHLLNLIPIKSFAPITHYVKVNLKITNKTWNAACSHDAEARRGVSLKRIISPRPQHWISNECQVEKEQHIQEWPFTFSPPTPRGWQ